MIAVMAKVGSIGKGRDNVQQHYKFRGIDDVYLALHDILAECGVFSTSEILSERVEDRESRSGGTLVYRVLHLRYTFHALDGTSVTSDVIGEGMDSGDKAANKAMSVGHKYALLQAFAIPTDEPKDPENDSPEAGVPLRPAVRGTITAAQWKAVLALAKTHTVTAEELAATMAMEPYCAASGRDLLVAHLPKLTAWIKGESR